MVAEASPMKLCSDVMPQDLTDDKSTLVQVMAWCRQATNHYLSQCWPTSLSPYGVTRPQWVNSSAIYLLKWAEPVIANMTPVVEAPWITSWDPWSFNLCGFVHLEVSIYMTLFFLNVLSPNRFLPSAAIGADGYCLLRLFVPCIRLSVHPSISLSVCPKQHCCSNSLRI